MRTILFSGFHGCFAAIILTLLSNTSSPAAVSEREGPVPNPRIKTTFAPVVKKVAQSVVKVYCTKTVEIDPQMHSFMNNPLLRDFFGDEFGGQNPPRAHQEQDLGSGVI